MISTPGPETYYMRQVMRQVDEKGQPKLFVLRFGTPCDTCMKTPTPWMCRCKDDNPNWISRAKQDELAFLYLKDDNFRAQELMAMHVSSVTHIWGPFVPLLRKQPLYAELNVPLSPVFFFIDCAAGGMAKTAITGWHAPDYHMHNSSHMVMIYYDTFHTPGADPRVRTEHLQTAVRHLRGHHLFANALIVLGVEDKPEGIGSQVHNDMRGTRMLTSIMFSGSDADPRYGLPIDDSIKQLGSRRVQSLLATGRVQYSRDLMTFENTPEAALKAKDEFERQLENWVEEPIENTKRPNAEQKYSYGGKIGNEQDDAAITFMHAALNILRYRDSMRHRAGLPRAIQ